MNIFKRFCCYIDNISHEIRLMNLKASTIFAGIYLVLGIISWVIVGKRSEITLFYIYPRCAMPLALAYVIWAVFFAFCGFILGSILFGCEKYKRHKVYKIAVFLILMQVFTYCVYPLFFGAAAPLICFMSLLVSMLFCIFSIIASSKIFVLWTICLCVNFLWLLYNSYVTLAFLFVN